MAGADPRRPRWQTATRASRSATRRRRAKTFRLALPEPRRHLAGQHYVVRLTAPDGYTASRSYSVASPPDGTGEIELTVERLDDGEVSTFLHDVVERRRRARGARPDRRLVRVGRRHARAARRRRLGRRAAHGDAAAGPPRPGAPTSCGCVVSVRTPDDLYYADELPGAGDDGRVHARGARRATRAAPGRMTADDLAPLVRADADRLRLRLARVRRRGHRPPAGGGRAGRADPRRAVRPFGLSLVTHR